MPPNRPNLPPTGSSLPVTVATGPNADTVPNPTQSIPGPVSHNIESLPAVRQLNARPNATDSEINNGDTAVSVFPVNVAPGARAPEIVPLQSSKQYCASSYNCLADAISFLTSARAYLRQAGDFLTESKEYLLDAERYHESAIRYYNLTMNGLGPPPPWPSYAERMEVFSINQGTVSVQLWQKGEELLRTAENGRQFAQMQSRYGERLNVPGIARARFTESLKDLDRASKAIQEGVHVYEMSKENYDCIHETFKDASRRYGRGMGS